MIPITKGLQRLFMSNLQESENSQQNTIESQNPAETGDLLMLPAPQEDKHPGGRPTDYSPEMVTKAQEYIDSCQDTDVETDTRIVKVKVNIPTKGGLAVHLGVSRETLYQWAKIYPEFSDIMERLGSEQEARLINNGLSGDYNPTIAKVLLTKHGYIDKQEIEAKGHITGGLSDKEKQELLELLKNEPQSIGQGN